MESVRCLLSVEDALARLGIGRTQFYGIVKGGDLRLVHIGRRSFVVSDEIDAFIDTLCASR